MGKCREAFEQLDGIAEILKGGYITFHVESNQYYTETEGVDTSDIDLAWEIYQSRQAEVDQLEEWNSNQAQSIKSYQEEDEAMKELLQKLIDDEYTTMRPSMAYEIQKALRGDDDINVTR
ncbi:hypothetical protein [Acinetobacter gerneri]|uniref:hypothetical protein n=1 Tax=Acinetobacter gerneri TaxID=202952 RepID=UPI0028B111A7|nr:hypothetical protein [Acinetobacter gerneri]